MIHKIYAVEVEFKVNLEAESCDDAERIIKEYFSKHQDKLEVSATHRMSYDDLTEEEDKE